MVMASLPILLQMDELAALEKELNELKQQILEVAQQDKELQQKLAKPKQGDPIAAWTEQQTQLRTRLATMEERLLNFEKRRDRASR
jgi:hypothetical protein